MSLQLIVCRHTTLFAASLANREDLAGEVNVYVRLSAVRLSWRPTIFVAVEERESEREQQAKVNSNYCPFPKL